MRQGEMLHEPNRFSVPLRFEPLDLGGIGFAADHHQAAPSFEKSMAERNPILDWPVLGLAAAARMEHDLPTAAVKQMADCAAIIVAGIGSGGVPDRLGWRRPFVPDGSRPTRSPASSAFRPNVRARMRPAGQRE